MKRKLVLSLIGFLLISSTALLPGCDGYLDFDCKVYEWVDAPVGFVGDIYVDTNAPDDRKTNPISDADVLVWGFIRGKTGIEGSFHVGRVVAPGRYMIDIKVEKEGYTALAAKFQGPGRHRIAVFMVRK